MNEPSLPEIRLKPREERRLRAGHLWVFSNEVDTAATPLKAFQPGDAVVVREARGKALGVGYVNPASLIAVRLVSRDPRQALSDALVAERVASALRLREQLFEAPFYRLVYGDSDGLPGLVVDRYGPHLVAQIATAGMERWRGAIAAALVQQTGAASLLWRNDGALRALEGLPAYTEAAHGEPPDEVELDEHGCRFRVALRTGQKTGWFYDQRDNRAHVLPWVRGARVLDVFSYVGAWAVQCAHAGAETVVAVDASGPTVARLRDNAERNAVGDRIRVVEDEAVAALKALRDAGERFDVVILDPPAFIKRRKDREAGLKAYQRLNQLALRVLRAGGILVSCSCSQPLAAGDLRRVVYNAARKQGRWMRVLAMGGQAADHPVHPAIPETEYLKCVFAAVGG